MRNRKDRGASGSQLFRKFSESEEVALNDIEEKVNASPNSEECPMSFQLPEKEKREWIEKGKDFMQINVTHELVEEKGEKIYSISKT